MSGAAKEKLIRWTWIEISLTSKATLMALDRLIHKMQVVRDSCRPAPMELQ